MLAAMRVVFPCLLLGVCAAVPVAGQGGGTACGLLSSAEIAKVSGLTVGNGAAGVAIPGVLGRCTWTAADHSRVIVTLADAHHMQITMDAQKTDGTAIPGLGTAAVGIKAADFTGGGYIVSVLDAHGGFGVSVLGRQGNRARAVALAKLVESHR